ncbi:sodium:calcium antiporter [Candidatus Poribacteria bacterium]|nr:sodium:calcium antiporter [Candidatus Poribacteria bacterium]MYB01313.1 sodium:calcium antiporter [Candidatus Poribacteria bacterium]
MEQWIEHLIIGLPSLVLFLIIVVTLYTLGKGADWLVDEAVALSTRWGLGKAVIGATIVSVGTTTPEAAVSVLSAIQGKPGLALGNAVGSIICDTGLIIGLASLIAPLPLNRQLASRLSNVQVGAGILLVAACFPWASPTKVFTQGGVLAQLVGVVFVVLLGLYIWQSIRWASSMPSDTEDTEDTEDTHAEEGNAFGILAKLIGSIAIIVVSAQILIPVVSVMAERIGVPKHIISATLVAFGTSLPELVTAITAVRRGHGELAVGNIIGADILNVLFVAGVSAAATQGGLQADGQFFQFLFPAMLFILIVFRCGIFVSGDQLKRPFGIVLVATWLLVTILSYVLSIEMH